MRQGTEQTDSAVPLILLSSREGELAGRSGYSLLADYLPCATLIERNRHTPTGLAKRFLTGILSRSALSRWYRLGSAGLEWEAWRRIRRGYSGVIHYLWADRDWGFLDYALNARRHKLCGTFHSCPDSFTETVGNPLRLKKLDAIILMSEVQRAFFEAHHVDPARIHVIPHGIDTQFFRPGLPSGLGPFVALAVGSYRRNFTRLRAVCERLRGRDDIRFRVIAPPSFRESFQDLSHVEFLSGLSDEQLVAQYQEAGCLVMTADAATANNAILEAMACGLPIVSEDIGGTREYVDSACAKLTAPEDVDALVAAVVSIAESPGLRSTMSRAARLRAEALDWNRIADRTLQLYGSIWSNPCV